MKAKRQKKTTVGVIDSEVLAFTAGRDCILDRALIEADCMGSAAHVTMLSRMPLKPRLFSEKERRQVIAGLVEIMQRAAQGKFEITLDDQDVHLAVERTLTEQLGDLGKKVHTGRSRNDQVALDLRLYGKDQLLGTILEAAELADGLTRVARRHAADPMVGRTHMQPAMPSSVGLWAAAFSESLLDDIALLINAFELNDQSPLGSAASYGVPLPLDRQLVSDLLGFSRPVHNVLYANNARGKLESIVLNAMSQVMLTLSRLAQDLILFSMPEFAYFSLPDSCCTGSSIMPQKKNPDVLELIRAKTSKVIAFSLAVQEIVKASPSGYNRDIQEAKEPFMDGISTARSSLRIMSQLVEGLKVNREKLLAGFTPDVFATDYALERVAGGMPFRDAYHYVKEHLDELEALDPYKAIAQKTHLGGTAGMDFDLLDRRISGAILFVAEERNSFYGAVSKLMGIPYPLARK
ncbi:MAG TPA: argininosuccinate lyase [Verrucomicrobia bacterium]|nr:MAG: argininosuccinate lyase [Lentisphaerae bacterium GWF2_57_35]HBA85851.1 argininosuccinate lyase [Verrucomicrobiota bacterium]